MHALIMIIFFSKLQFITGEGGGGYKMYINCTVQKAKITTHIYIYL